MIWAAVIGGITALINSAVQGGVATAATKKKVDAYQQAADKMRKSAQENSGAALNAKMTQEGAANAAKYGSLYFDPSWQGGTSKMAAFNKANEKIKNTNPYIDLYEQGANRAATKAAGQWNADNAKAQQVLKQADIDYNADVAKGQAVANGIGQVGSFLGNMGGAGGLKDIKSNAGNSMLGSAGSKLSVLDDLFGGK